MSDQPPAECCVSGALSCALRMSRAAGVAPLRLQRTRTGWRARLSPAASVYGEILALTLCVLALVAFIINDYIIAVETSTKTAKQVKRTVHFVELAFLTVVLLTTAFTGTIRMKNMIVYLNQIHKINLELSSYGCTPSNDKKCWLLLILSMIGGIIALATDFGEFMYFGIFYRRKVLISMTYLFYILLYLVLLIIQIQFALLVLAALSPLKQINGCLKDLLEEINSQGNTRHTSQKKLKINNFILPGTEEDGTQPIPKQQRDIPEAVNHLTHLHSGVCDVVRLVDESHGPILLVLMLSYLLHLVIALYFIFKLFLTDAAPLFYNLTIQSLWGIFHMSGVIIVVEPCHKTQEEMAYTRELVSQMILQVLSPDDPLSIEVELFYRRLVLNQVTYSPLKMFTINRALIVTMLSAITTYLVVVIKL